MKWEIIMNTTERKHLTDMLNHFIQDDKVSASQSLNKYLEHKANRKINEGKHDKDLFVLYVSDDDGKYYVQFTDEERSVVKQEWIDTKKDFPKGSKAKIVKYAAGTEIPNSIE